MYLGQVRGEMLSKRREIEEETEIGCKTEQSKNIYQGNGPSTGSERAVQKCKS